MIRVENPDGSWREFTKRPPRDTPFRWRVKAARMCASWDLLNGRFVRRPLRHRLPPEPFVSKQHERMDEFLLWLRSLTPPHRRKPSRRPRAPHYWWGEFARMRIPASRGMAELNRGADRMLAEEDRMQAMERRHSDQTAPLRHSSLGAAQHLLVSAAVLGMARVGDTVVGGNEAADPQAIPA